MTFKEAKGSSDAFWGWSTVTDEAGDPYMFRAWVGRLRLHVFYRGDFDPDPHDHPWDFWTFPLTPYVEEVVQTLHETYWVGHEPAVKTTHRFLYHDIVPAFRPSFRPATHCHRVLGRHKGMFYHETWGSMHQRQFAGDPGPGYEPLESPGKIITLVWRSEKKRSWGFLKNREGQWCWIGWRDYIFNGGKEGPCQ